MKAIRAVVDQIVARWNPEKVILFGSHAYGTPTPDSDVDLLIIMPVEQGSTARAAGKMYSLIDYGFPMDLIVRTPEKIAHSLAIGDFFIRRVMQEGRELYAVPHRPMG